MTFLAFSTVGESRIRERAGLYFEEFAVGQTFHHRPGFTVSQQDNASEALATLNQAMVHTDAHYAAQTEFERPLVVSTITLQKALGLGWKTFGRRRRIVRIGEVRLVAPVFGGDTLYASSRIAGLDAADEPDCGLVDTEATVRRQDGEPVAHVSYLQEIYRSGRGPFAALDY